MYLRFSLSFAIISCTTLRLPRIVTQPLARVTPVYRRFLLNRSHQSFEAYIYSLIGEEKISRELWERTMNDLLSNPAKLKNYPFQMDREKLNGLR